MAKKKKKITHKRGIPKTNDQTINNNVTKQSDVVPHLAMYSPLIP